MKHVCDDVDVIVVVVVVRCRDGGSDGLSAYIKSERT